MKENVLIRPMQITDVPCVSQLESALFSYPWGQAAFYDCLSSPFYAWVMTSDDLILGYAIVMLAADESQLLSIGIAESLQGQGWGHYLLKAIVALVQAKGIEKMFLEVRVSNISAIRLYERFGFEYVGIRRAYYPAEQGREDARVYTLGI